ncbi:nitrate/sulfonate/bicarbonate ABC transporter, periplasmic substrate-binding protein [Campylobacter blaseri]|uniref:ABC transporter substrate-binding protein n=1 Tax=Campylobacter blaseri TaxID=2042961 RepID=A0A2P8R3M3_9BACT|nr:ABC transporter substrate-binding protein [Campylobacter blaseri]PSM53085.1 hypothetical protein CQ405_00600 [Campylobacter blaseri]PSM54552.1 hypothetical protein CRN67_00600 [Campylobacter blaseri]QKF86977.1 nitrate/sulfonate/bicarbonate ABC transporter, periplasmic substrate-binding protein [Campylobacter blaseri]
MKRREFLSLGSAFGISAFAPNLFAKENFTIYGAPAVPSAIIAIASLQGKLSKSMNTELKIWKTPDQLRAGVASKTFKVMMSPSNVGVNLKNQNQNVAMLNILTESIQNIITKDKNIKELGDLEGKKMIMPFKNDMPDLIFHALCKKQGVDVSKIDITYTTTPPESMLMLLQSKDYVASILPEPMGTAAIFKGKKLGVSIHRSIAIHKEWGKSFNTANSIPQAGMIVDVDYYNNHIKEFEVFHEDLKNALIWLNGNKQSAAEIASAYLPANKIIIANSFEHANLCVKKASDIRDEIMEFFEIMFEFNPKILGGKMPDKGFFL